MTLFYAERGGQLTHLERPDMVQGFLGSPDHWRPNRSAMCLAEAWFAAAGLPAKVHTLLLAAPEWAGAKLVQGMFEQQTDLDERRGPSQTDLLALCATNHGLAVLAVEGKVDETFDLTVSEKRAAAERNPRSTLPGRIDELCQRLSIPAEVAAALAYQLLHRTAAALIEAKRYRTRTAAVLVHSFARTPQLGHYADFAAFIRVLGIVPPQPNGISEPFQCEGIALRFAWVAEPLPVG